MKDILRDKRFYYVLIPILAACWPLWARFVGIPAAESGWDDEQKKYNKAQVKMMDILTLDGERLKLSGDTDGAEKFDYSTEVAKAAKVSGISPANYKLNVRRTIKVGQQYVQGANLTLEKVDIVKFAEFLAGIQASWPNLQCSQLKLTQQKGMPDTWKVNIQFKYYK